MVTTPEQTAMATRIIRDLTGRRFTWPPMRVVDRYPIAREGKIGRVRLVGRPVIEVHGVTVNGMTADFEQVGRQWLEVAYVPCREVQVDYTYGCKPAKDLVKAIGVMADEIALAENSDPNCRIPDRVTSVTRQGTSWTLIDPQDFLDEGRTGIYEIDLVIKAAGGPKARSAVFTTQFPPPHRLSAVEVVVP